MRQKKRGTNKKRTGWQKKVAAQGCCSLQRTSAPHAASVCCSTAPLTPAGVQCASLFSLALASAHRTAAADSLFVRLTRRVRFCRGRERGSAHSIASSVRGMSLPLRMRGTSGGGAPPGFAPMPLLPSSASAGLTVGAATVPAVTLPSEDASMLLPSPNPFVALPSSSASWAEGGGAAGGFSSNPYEMQWMQQPPRLKHEDTMFDRTTSGKGKREDRTALLRRSALGAHAHGRSRCVACVLVPLAVCHCRHL